MPLDYTGQGWRGSVLAALASTTRLLAFTPRDSLPRPYTVNVVARLVGDAATLNRSLIGQSLLVTYTNGGVSKTIAVDLAAGGTIFDVVADSITIDVVNAGTAIVAVQGAITRYVEGAPWRSPFRTVIGPVSGAGGFVIEIPQGSKSFIYHNRNASLPGIFRDGNGVDLNTFGLMTTVNVAPQWGPIPLATKQIASVGANATSMLFIFEIGT